MRSPPVLVMLLLASLLVGCRSSEVMSCRVAIPEGLTSCGDITIRQTLTGRDIGVEQGKTVDAGASVAASVAATLRDITASQSGNATGGSDTGAGGAEAAAESAPPSGQPPVAAPPSDAPTPPAEKPAAAPEAATVPAPPVTGDKSPPNLSETTPAAPGGD